LAVLCAAALHVRTIPQRPAPQPASGLSSQSVIARRTARCSPNNGAAASPSQAPQLHCCCIGVAHWRVWERLRRCGAISEQRGKISSPAKDRQRRQQNDYSVSLPAAESLSRSTAPAHRRESTEAYGSTPHSVGTVVRNYWLAASRQREFPRDACAPHRRERACSPSQTGEAAEAAARALRWSRQQRRQQWRS
jgi:hypothetical protein